MQGVADDLKSSTLPHETKKRYMEAVRSVYQRMPKVAVERFNKYTSGATYYADESTLTDAITGGDSSKLGGKLARGAYESRTGILHLDSDNLGLKAREVYAHEFGHAIDGPDKEISSSREWMEAWKEEIQGGGLTTYATTKPSEGLAEFTRLLYGTEHSDKLIRKKFPKASAVFDKWDIWRKG